MKCSLIDSRFRTKADRKSRAIMSLMGADQTMRSIMNNLDVFSIMAV